MGAPIDIYFDFSSPYRYVASQKIETPAATHSRAVGCRPLLQGIVFRRVGAAPLVVAGGF